MAFCSSCDRDFPSQSSLTQHLKTSSRHAWCDRCQKSFNSTLAKQQHLKDSSNHYICRHCLDQPDFWSRTDLVRHLEKVHDCCVVCDKLFASPQRLIDHDVAKHNMCMTCRSYFGSPSNLKSVSFAYLYGVTPPC